jgi:signal transduction histidine kinase
MARLIEGKSRFFNMEKRLFRGDGSLIWVNLTVVPMWEVGESTSCHTAIIEDVTERKRVETEVRDLNEPLEHRVAQRTAESQWRANQLQKLATQMSQAEERERRRLAQVLHDGLQQTLVAANLRLTRTRSTAQDARITGAVQEAHRLIDEAISESQSLTKELSPPVLYDGGLATGLEWLGRETERKHRLPVSVEVAPELEPDDLTTKVFVFQTVRELILNAVKHAHASALKIRLARLAGTAQSPPAFFPYFARWAARAGSPKPLYAEDTPVP